MIKTDRKIYLASKSPRRRKLLQLLLPHIHLLAVETPELQKSGESPSRMVKRIAEEKMDAAMVEIKSGIIITADTTVFFNTTILGKPRNKQEAHKFLKMLSGNTHTVYTGICVQALPENIRFTGYEKTRVTFREISDTEIAEYIDSGSPMDKAGAYGIQDDYGAVFVKKITGCYYNVVGLPLHKTYTLLNKLMQYV